MILARLCKEHATSPCPRKQQVLQVHCLGHRSKTALRTSKPPLQLYALHHEVRIRRQATPAQRRFLFRQDLMSIPTTVIFKKFPATSEAASTATTCCHHTSRVLNTLTGYLNDASAKSTTSTLMLTSPTTPQRTLGSSLAAQPSSAKSTKSSTTTSRKAYLKTAGHPTPPPTSSIAKHPVAAVQRSQRATAKDNYNNMLFNTPPHPLPLQ
jgi:hypothetical protein